MLRRFVKDGYRVPKPLINIVGRPMLFWLLDNLHLEAEDTVWLGVQRSLELDFALGARLRREFPRVDLRMIYLDLQTRGAAETLLIILQVLVVRWLRSRVVCFALPRVNCSACGILLDDTGRQPHHTCSW